MTAIQRQSPPLLAKAFRSLAASAVDMFDYYLREADDEDRREQAWANFAARGAQLLDLLERLLTRDERLETSQEGLAIIALERIGYRHKQARWIARGAPGKTDREREVRAMFVGILRHVEDMENDHEFLSAVIAYAEQWTADHAASLGADANA